jgi:phosphoglycerol transferase MdoB-like AlkP superfamily enzyme
LNVYPDIRQRTRLLKRLIAVFVYVLLAVEIILCLVDYYMDDKMGWSFVTGICILYAIFTVVYSFNHKNSHIRKLFAQSFAAMLFLVLLDVLTGGGGWSVVYGVPCAVLILDVALVICMLVNLPNWQSYLLLQVFTLLVSTVLLVLYLAGVTKIPAIPWTVFGVSALIFSFCLCFGYHKAKSELRRRFYI